MTTISEMLSNIDGLAPHGHVHCIHRTRNGKISHMTFPVNAEIPHLPANLEILEIPFTLSWPIESTLHDKTPVTCDMLSMQFSLRNHRITKPKTISLHYLGKYGFHEKLPASCEHAVWGTVFAFAHPRTLAEYLPDPDLMRSIEHNRKCGYDILREQDEITRAVYGRLRNHRFR